MSFQDDSRIPDITESTVLDAASDQGGSVDTVFSPISRPQVDEGQAGETAPQTGETQAGKVEADAGNEREAEEIGGPQGAEPTRFGDWERNGRCSDF